MFIATRDVVLRDQDRDVQISVRIHAPEKVEVDWICRYEIGWPEGSAKRWGAGVDAVQALLIAMQMIGSEIYASAYHQAGRLRWLSPGGGYGFPVSNNMRDLLGGDDRRFL